MTASSRPVHILAVGSSLGAPHEGPGAGPEALRDWGLAAFLDRRGLAVRWDPCPRCAAPRLGGTMAERLEQVGDLCQHLADQLETLVRDGARPLILGGDHAIAAGTWRGVARALAPRGPLGLIWIDAHLDSHTPDSTQSGNIHGMPLAALLGFGAVEMAGLPGPHLAPNHVCVVGARSWEAAELELLTRLGVRIFGMDEVRRRGLSTVLCEAMTVARRGTAGFGVSIDLDALDPAVVSGTTCPEPGGLDPQELADTLHALRACADLVALEIVEYMPKSDPHGHTAHWIAELAEAVLGSTTGELRAREQEHGAHNYDPLPVVFTRGEGVWLWDVEGRRYLDMMSAYSAVSFGHAHPRLVQALTEQAGRLALTSRAYSNDRLPLLLERLTSLLGYDAALPMNTGMEAVETALKAVRKWAYKVKGVAADRAEIIACEGNFHGRTITIVGMSSEAQYRDGFGPFPAGLKRIPYGDARALEAAITPNTAAFLVEPIQGEGGIIVPPAGWLARCAEICRRHNVLLVADEVQTGLGRTGKLLACHHEGVRPDGVILGKALGGGLLPVSAFLADRAVMDVFHPGDHGSTFGGNPLGAAVALAALDLLVEERLVEHAAHLGQRLLNRLQELQFPWVRAIRGRGLLVGVDLDPEQVSARLATEHLLARGVMTKDTHGTVLRLAPPLIIDEATLDWAVDVLTETLATLPVRRLAGAKV
jgi:ornithine--oxo-acid transaminase